MFSSFYTDQLGSSNKKDQPFNIFEAFHVKDKLVTNWPVNPLITILIHTNTLCIHTFFSFLRVKKIVFSYFHLSLLSATYGEFFIIDLKKNLVLVRLKKLSAKFFIYAGFQIFYETRESLSFSYPWISC